MECRIGLACACLLLPSAASAGDGQHHVSFADEAGSTHVAVLSVTPWAEARADLQPNFTLTEPDAIAKVLPTTGQTEERLLDILSASLRVATPTLSYKDVLETKSATGQPTVTTSDDTRTRSSGDTANAPTLTAPSGTAAALPGAPTTWTGNFGEDPMLQYLAATALKQEVTLLDRYVKDAAVPIGGGAETYVVRLQFTALPAERNMPYDVFTDISFLPGAIQAALQPDGNGCQPALSVLPMLVTDDIEEMLRSNTTDTTRQFGLSLAGMLYGVGLSASGQKSLDRLTRSLGKESNSLFTIARLSSDTIRVRLGASSVPAPVKFAMEPRTHAISLLVTYSPCTAAPAQDQIEAMTAVARTEYHDAESGRILPNRNATPQQARSFNVYAERYGLKMTTTTRRALAGLALYAAAGDYRSFRTLALRKGPFAGQSNDAYLQYKRGWDTHPYQDAVIDGLYSALLADKRRNWFSYTPVDFIRHGPIALPPVEQTVLIPSGASDAVVHLYGGRTLAGAGFTAELRVGDVTVPATKVQPVNDGTGLDITLPALKPYALPKTPASLYLATMASPAAPGRLTALMGASTVEGASRQQTNYRTVRIIAETPPDPRKPAFTLAGPNGAIRADSSGAGEASVTVKAGSGAGSLTLAVNRDIKTFSASGGITMSNGVITVTGAGLATFGFRNLSGGDAVTFALLDKDEKTIGKTVEMRVSEAKPVAGK